MNITLTCQCNKSISGLCFVLTSLTFVTTGLPVVPLTFQLSAQASPRLPVIATGILFIITGLLSICIGKRPPVNSSNSELVHGELVLWDKLTVMSSFTSLNVMNSLLVMSSPWWVHWMWWVNCSIHWNTYMYTECDQVNCKHWEVLWAIMAGNRPVLWQWVVSVVWMA